MDGSVRDLQAEYRALCQKVGVVDSLSSTPRHDGAPHVEFVNGCYHYVVTERGTECERKTTTEKDEILYWLLSNVAHSIASSHEVAHRIKGKDSRRLLFARQIEVLEQLNPAWGERWRHEIETILKEHPYDDGPGKR